ncbi:MAG TPA: PGPGW domain-containing protein [Labilithrix sp.]
MLHVSRTVEVIALVSSVAMFVFTVVAVPLFFARIPADYFLRENAHRLHVRIARNAIGVVLVGLGIAMLVLPGQGVLTILVGLTLLDVPLKDRVVRWLLCHARVKHAVDALRAKAGNGPLIPPPPTLA